jgi:cytosine/adenosine deaminase-related metal-dependent hydrolase
MVKYISADFIYPIKGEPIKNGVMGIDDQGSIVVVLTSSEAESQNIKDIERFEGVLVPGFVNTHCHLELSHLKNKISENTGLTGFIKEILAIRDQPIEEIHRAMGLANKEMYANGIVAVGDISNQSISKAVKLNSEIYYHTFVEVFGFNSLASETIAKGLAIKTEFFPLKASIVPHAPYSVSSTLFDEIRAVTLEDDILTIHNQETIAENELFESGTGAFADFFETLGIAQNEAHNSKKNALNYHLPQLPKTVNTLLVHNTFSNSQDLEFAKQHHQKLYWCLCPNANLYIENELPDVELFKRENLKITLGTDSLASNHQLNILAEMKTLQDNKQIGFNESIKWATLNGAEFLGIDSRFGSFEVGKKPGINLIKLNDKGKIADETQIKRLF